MSLMAIILWALYPLSPWKRFHEHVRHLIQTFLDALTDPQTLDWLSAHPEHPEGIARIEQGLDALAALTDHLIYQKAREILGLPYMRWMGMRSAPPHRRRANSLKELFARIEACALRFDDIERLAERRAEKLARLLAKNPTVSFSRAGEGPRPLTEHRPNSGGRPIYLIAPPFEATAPPVSHQIAAAAVSAHASLPFSGVEASGVGANARVFIFVSAPTRAGLRVRAPPWRPTAITDCLLPQRPARLRARICAQTAPPPANDRAAWTSPLDFALSASPCL